MELGERVLWVSAAGVGVVTSLAAGESAALISAVLVIAVAAALVTRFRR